MNKIMQILPKIKLCNTSRKGSASLPISGFLCIFVLLPCSKLIYAQETTNPDYPKFIMQEVDFEIDGLTNKKTLVRKVDMEIGREFESFRDLKSYVDMLKQKMINQRVFENVYYTIETIYSDDNLKKYRIIWKIKDSWTLFAIPYPKYDSNTGWRIGLQVFYDNAFGSMTNWFLGLNYNFGNKEYTIRPKISGIKIGPLSFSIGVKQSHQVERKLDGTSVLSHWKYNKTDFNIGTSINIYSLLSYGFSPSFSFRYDYMDIAGKKGFNEDFFDFSFNHSLSYSKIDWKENFREGFSVSLENNLSTVNRENIFHLTSRIRLNGRYYWIWKILNSYSRAGIEFAFDNPILGYGNHLRGVINDDMHGDWGAYFNTSLGIRFWRWEGVWDAQMHPFVDMGLTGEYGSDLDFKEDFKASTGIDFVLYLDVFKNLLIRGTIGFDLTSGRPLEESYEIIITSKLHY